MYNYMHLGLASWWAGGGRGLEDEGAMELMLLSNLLVPSHQISPTTT
jgi:hypothetical protein